MTASARFIDDVWKLGSASYEPTTESDEASTALRRRVHQTIAKVDADMVEFKWNTAVAAMMTLRNSMLDALRGLEAGELAVDGFVYPGHVSAIIGSIDPALDAVRGSAPSETTRIDASGDVVLDAKVAGDAWAFTVAASLAGGGDPPVGDIILGFA